MQQHKSTRHCLTALSVLAFCSRGVFADGQDDKKDAPKPLPQEIVKAWSEAGATIGWMKNMPPQKSGGYDFWAPWREKVEAGAVPAFEFYWEKAGDLAKLPVPEVAFGLDVHCSPLEDAAMKGLAGLKSLHSLNLGGTSMTDAGLKELAILKNLQALYLFHTGVTDAGLKELVAAAHKLAKRKCPGLKGLPMLATAHDWDTVHRTT